MKIISSVRKTISLVILMIIVDIGRFQYLPGPLLRSSIMIIIVIALFHYLGLCICYLMIMITIVIVLISLPICICHLIIKIIIVIVLITLSLYLMIDIRCWAVTYPLFSSSNCWKIWSRTCASLFWCACLLLGHTENI